MESESESILNLKSVSENTDLIGKKVKIELDVINTSKGLFDKKNQFEKIHGIVIKITHSFLIINESYSEKNHTWINRDKIIKIIEWS